MNDEEKKKIVERMLKEDASYLSIASAIGYTSNSGLKSWAKRNGVKLPKRKEFKGRAGYDNPAVNERRQAGIKAYYERKKREKQEKAAAEAKANLAASLSEKYKVKGVPEKEAEPMSSIYQRFEKAGPDPEGANRNGVRIRCGSCGKTSVFRKQGMIDATHASQVFRNKGWAVGGGPRADRCPECKSGLGKHTAPEPVKPVVQAPLVDQITEANRHPEFPQPVTPPEIVTEMPFFDKPLSEMTRADKRIIFNKLHETYGDETTGYKGDWNDEKIAVDLGVPVIWVASVRDEDFGPAINAVERARQVAEVLAMVDVARKQHATLQNEVMALAGRVKSYQDHMAALEEKLVGLK